jgi:hypothetical protein
MRFYLVLHLLCLLPFGTEAQLNVLLGQRQDTTRTVQQQTPPAKTDSIPTASDLIIAYEESSRTIREISHDMLSNFQTETIEQDYEELHDNLIRYYEIDSSQITSTSLSGVNDLIIIFERRNAILQGWQDELTEMASTLSSHRIELIKIKDLLTVDYNDLTENGQDYYDRRFRPIYDEADSLDQEIKQKLEEILTLEFEVAKDYGVTSRRIETLQQYLRNYWRDVRQAEESAWDFDVKKEKGERTFNRTLWRIVSFFINNSARTILLILIVLGIYLALRRIRLIDEWKDESNEDHKILYTNSLSLSLIVGATLFPLVYPPTTTLMYDFVLLISYIPFLVILKNSIDRKYFTRFLIFYITFLGLKLQNLLLPPSGFSSLVLIACAVILVLLVFRISIMVYFSIPETLYKKKKNV